MYQVYTPEQTGPYSVLFARFGRNLTSLEAAQRTAKRLHGQVRAYGSNAILADFSDGFALEPIPDIGRRQTPVQALQARGLQ